MSHYHSYHWIHASWSQSGSLRQRKLHSSMDLGQGIGIKEIQINISH